ncbi:sigma-70 family RNA polymerase sigma factor [Gottschalkia acidurici]|uniref:sigma-70 family RNA polymerase sigma factor n=1 Tax=Clostridium acidurici TaxID=1556 RepID=UPI003B83634B
MNKLEYSETELVEGIKNKDLLAYDYLINKYTKTIYCLAYNILHQSFKKEDIEECVSDVLLDTWLKIDEFKDEKGNFRTWILILTKYKALTYKRKNKLENVVYIDKLEVKDEYELEKQVVLRQDQEKVIDTINSFNKIDREIFFRRYFFNEKISDLAKCFKLSRSAIDNRLFRGRKTILEVLDDEGRKIN